MLTVYGRNHINKYMKTIKNELVLYGLFSISMGIYAENIWEAADTTQAATDFSNSSATYSDSISYSPVASEQDATYVIKKGDTLWDLAFQFLGNPFEWQKIWQINSYITNPDLIYPGNTLQIPGRSSETVSPNIPDNLIPSETIGALDFNAASTITENTEMYPGDFEVLSSLQKKNIMSSSQLSSVPFLWTQKDQNGLIYPGNGVVDPPKQGACYQQYSKLKITLFKNVKYTAGDTIDIYKSIRFVMFNDKAVNLVQCVGSAVVKEVTKNKLEALLFKMSDFISGNERITEKKICRSLQIDTLLSPEVAISGEVVTRVEQTASPYPFQMIILNKGSTHGVQVGDIFVVYHKKTALLSVIGIIVHTDAESSTLNMAYMRQNIVEDGDKVKLIRRAKLSEGIAENGGKVDFSGAAAPY
jgi:hypothetical protein